MAAFGVALRGKLGGADGEADRRADAVELQAIAQALEARASCVAVEAGATTTNSSPA